MRSRQITKWYSIRLEADLARAECGRHLGQRFQLLADTEPVGCRGHRHAASPADPGGGRDVAVDQVSTGLLNGTSLAGELTLERVDDTPKLLGIYPALLPSLKLANRRLEFGEGCAPTPDMMEVYQTYVRGTIR